MSETGGLHDPAVPYVTADQMREVDRAAVEDYGVHLLQMMENAGRSLAELAQLRVPRAVIWGADDTVDSLGSGRTTAAALHTRLQTIPRAGHLSMLARPRATARLILHFVAARGAGA